MTDICPKSIELKTAAELLTLRTAEGITEYLRQAAPSHPLLNQVFRMQRIAQISDERTVALLAYYALVALEKSQWAYRTTEPAMRDNQVLSDLPNGGTLPADSPSNFVSDVPHGNGPSCGYCGAIMVSTAWQCKSCGTATETSAQASPAESVAETAHPEPGEWVPHNLETQWQCCDCKLVHVVRFRLSETGQLEVSMTRDEDETSKVRGGNAKEWLKLQGHEDRRLPYSMVMLSDLLEAYAAKQTASLTQSSRPKIICLCGSTKFIEDFAVLNIGGYISPAAISVLDETEGQKEKP